MNTIKQLAYRFRSRVGTPYDIYNEANCYPPFQEVHDAIHELLHIEPTQEGEAMISFITFCLTSNTWAEWWRTSNINHCDHTIHDIEANIHKLKKSPHYNNIVRRLRRNLPIQRKKWGY